MSTANLISWLPFDTSTTLDKLGNTWTAHGNVSLSAEISRFGNASVHLPSGAYLTASNIIDLNIDAWTFDAWIYRVSDTGDDGYFALSSGSSGRHGILTGYDGVWIAVPGGGSWQASNRNLLFPSTTAKWNHVAIVKDGMSLNFYENGDLVWTATITDSLDDNGLFYLGGDNYGYGNDLYIDEVRFHNTALWTENFTPPTADDYIALALEFGNSYIFGLNADFELDIANDTQKWKWYRLVSWLSFDTSATFDKRGNTWTAYGSPVAKDGKLQLDGASYLQMSDGISLGGQDFTIRGEARMSTDTAQAWGGLFAFNGNQLRLIRYNSETEALEVGIKGSVAKITTTRLTDKFHFEIDYTHSDGVWRVFFNGAQVYSKTARLEWTTYARVYVGGNGDSNASGNKWGGSIDEFQIYDGVALHTENFTPNPDDYITCVLELGGAVATFDIDTDFALDEKNPRYVEELMINSDLTAWLPFNDYPTEDYCENWWLVTTDQIFINQKLSGIERDDNHDVALYLAGSTTTERGQLCLNCQGMYLGGRDFTVSFDWWYGGSMSFASNYPFGFFGSTLGDIYIKNSERWSPDFQRASLQAFGQSTADFGFSYRTWHAVRLEYSHADSKLRLLFDDTVKGELDVTIPRTLFPYVEIDRAGQGTGVDVTTPHGSGYISNLIIRGGDMAVGCGEVIWLAVYKNGQSTLYPFRPFEFVGQLAVALRYDQRTWYNVLRELDTDRASDYDVLYKGTTYALTKG